MAAGTYLQVRVCGCVADAGAKGEEVPPPGSAAKRRWWFGERYLIVVLETLDERPLCWEVPGGAWLRPWPSVSLVQVLESFSPGVHPWSGLSLGNSGNKPEEGGFCARPILSAVCAVGLFLRGSLFEVKVGRGLSKSL